MYELWETFYTHTAAGTVLVKFSSLGQTPWHHQPIKKRGLFLAYGFRGLSPGSLDPDVLGLRGRQTLWWKEYIGAKLLMSRWPGRRRREPYLTQVLFFSYVIYNRNTYLNIKETHMFNNNIKKLMEKEIKETNASNTSNNKNHGR